MTKPKTPEALERLKTGNQRGGVSRWAHISKEERSAYAKRIVAARWAKRHKPSQ